MNTLEKVCKGMFGIGALTVLAASTILNTDLFDNKLTQEEARYKVARDAYIQGVGFTLLLLSRLYKNKDYV